MRRPFAADPSAGRVLLRTPTPQDREEFLQRVRDSTDLHRPWIVAPATAAQYDAYVARMSHESYAGFFARRRTDGALVGYFNLGHIVRDPLQSAYLGYSAFTPFAGQGYMTEALHLVLAQAFGPLRLHRLEANIQPANAPSIALVRRCGFQLEGFSPQYLKIGGRWRDHERWAIRRETWR